MSSRMIRVAGLFALVLVSSSTARAQIPARRELLLVALQSSRVGVGRCRNGRCGASRPPRPRRCGVFWAFRLKSPSV